MADNPPRPVRKQDIANLTLNLFQAITLAGLVWTAAIKYQQIVSAQERTLWMVGDTKSDVGRLAERIVTLERNGE